MSSVTNESATASKSVIQVDEHQIRSHVEEVVRASVEETLNGLLDAEADQLCGAKKYDVVESVKTREPEATTASYIRRREK